MHVGPSRYGATELGGRARQANLLGGFADDIDAQAAVLSQHLVTKKGKTWDRTAFAQTGRRNVPLKKGNEPEPEEEDGEEEHDDDQEQEQPGGFAQFPKPSAFHVDRA
jgi:hypothetical protein